MIDWDRVTALREEVGPEDFEEVVELFLQEVDEEIQSLNTENTDRNPAELLHFLKGSALSLGFSEFSTLCQKGETDLQSDPNSAIDFEALRSSYGASRVVFLQDLPKLLAS